MGTRHTAREHALQFLYQRELNRDGRDQALAAFWEHFDGRPEGRVFTERLIRGVEAHTPEIDTLIRDQARHWKLERMAAVDRNILRLAVYELLFEPDTPPAVVINEAIELGKRFGSSETAAFLNGVLDGIRKKLADKTDRAEPA